MANYRPQIYIRTADANVSLQWPEGTQDANEKMVRYFGPHLPLITDKLPGYAW
jgi:elongation factor Tu